MDSRQIDLALRKQKLQMRADAQRAEAGQDASAVRTHGHDQAAA